MDNIRYLVYIAVLFVVSAACGSSDEGNSTSDDYIETIMDQCRTPPVSSVHNSPMCENCLCEKCPDLVAQCDSDCFELIICMHNNCNENVEALDECAQNACTEYQAGLTGAKNIASCMYDPSDRGPGENKSCFISCNFGT